MSPQMKGYCIAFRNYKGIPGVYFVCGREGYHQTLNDIKREGETLIGVFTGDQQSAIDRHSEAEILIRNDPPSLEKKLRGLGFKLPRPN